MENQESQEHTTTKGKTAKTGTMSFIDHLDELRRRLIRYLVVLMIFVLGAYAFRKDILDLVRKPVDEPLKKYTSTEQYKPSIDSKDESITKALDSYNCACTEIPIIKPGSNSEETPQSESGDETTKSPEKDDLQSQIDTAAETAGNWVDVLKETINDFVIFFQVAVGKDPSPIFETDKHSNISQTIDPSQTYQPLPDHLNLNCKCTLASAAVKSPAPHSSMVFIGLPELFFSQMKVAIFAAVFLSFPYLLIELWGFVGPALYRSEKKVFWIFAISSYFFFIGGALFGYFVVFPFGFDFFLSLTQMGEIMPSLSVGEYLSFSIKLLLAFGFIFELPLVTFILARMGIVTPELMIKQARIAVLIVFILSAFLTPPDPLTMMFMAGPLLILYILSIFVCFLGVNRQKASLRAQGVDPDEFED